MLFYDANLSYGTVNNVDEKPIIPCATMDGLVAALRRAGVSGGLVRVEAADESGVALGNSMLKEDLAAAPDDLALYGMYSLLPSYTREIPSPDKLPEVMREGKFKILRVAPKKHKYLARAGVLSDYFEMATAKNIPVMFDTACGISLEETYDIMERFPNMTAILAYYNIWPTERYERPFLAQFPNLRMDLSGMINDQGIEGLTKEYGCGRFIFGSRFPRLYIGGVMMLLKRADIPEEDKAAIAGGNLLAMVNNAEI